MASGEVVIGVVGILTSGVLGPLVMHHAQKDRDTLNDMRATLDAAIEPLAKARAQGAWLDARAFEASTDKAEVERRAEDLVHQLMLVEAQGVKLAMRFPDARLAEAYMAAGGALNAQASALWRRREGVTPTLVQYQQEWHEAEGIYSNEYGSFVAEASKWNLGSHWPAGPPHP